MGFIRHSNLVNVHALLSPSSYHWINYDDDKLDKVFYTHMEARKGTELHELAEKLIRLRIKLPDDNKTLSMYVNDAIGFRMEPEVVFYYSDNCFGTADCAKWTPTTRLLRIHDLKTGTTPASMMQLRIYAALFCLEMQMDPFKMNFELRIYQNDSVIPEVCDPADIKQIMEDIKYKSRRIDMLREESL